MDATLRASAFWEGLSPEAAKVMQHRYTTFKKFGFDRADARVLAEADVDLHYAENLLKRGCPIDYALMILL